MHVPLVIPLVRMQTVVHLIIEVSHPTWISCALLARWYGLVLLAAGAEGAMCN